MSDIKVFSFFSGSGFLDLGFEMNGFDVDFVNEFSPTFMNAYIYARGKMKLRKPQYGYFNTDINIYLEENSSELLEYVNDARRNGNLVGFIGGPPCPDFSVAGKNRGCDGDNGKLSQSYIDTIIKMKPDFFLFENVKGLWKTARHREFFESLKRQLDKAGYETTQNLVNALEYGVPQDRDRILLFGITNDILKKYHKDANFVKLFPWELYKENNLNEVKEMPWPATNPFVEDGKLACPKNIKKELTVEYWFKKNCVDKHANAKDFFTPREGLKRMLTIDEGDVCKKSYKRLHRWRYSPTAAYGNNEVHLHPYRVRRLSAAEALAIQSLPKEFQLPHDMTLTDKFKTIGNGVPYLLSSGIAKSVKHFLEEIQCEK